jgi:small GTP-binding protein
VVNVEVKGEPIELALWDTVGQEDPEDRLRPLSYQDANAFLVCFSIDTPDSLENILWAWYPNIQHFGAEQVPRFLVGCKKDLRNDERALQALTRGSWIPVTTEQGREVAKAIGAEYFECSAKTGEGVRELFVRVMESMEADKFVRFENENLTGHGIVPADVSLFDARRLRIGIAGLILFNMIQSRYY